MKTFTTDCIGAIGEDIGEMVDEATEITRRTFLKHVKTEEMKNLEIELGYAGHYKQGLTMSSDWHVSYWKSKYKDDPCVYFSWSAIEYIFV